SDLSGWTWHKNDTVSLVAFMLTSGELSLGLSHLAYQHSAQAVAGRPALTIPKLNEATLPRKHLCRQFPAIFPRHGALDVLDNCRAYGSIILELLGAIND